MKRFVLPLLIWVVLLQTSVRAQVPDTSYDVDSVPAHSADASPATTDGPEVSKEVLDILTRMTEFISGASAFTIVADMGHEVLQQNGQRLEFGSHITASLRRPSQANVRFDNRDGENATIILDGEAVSVFSTRGNAYVYDTTRQTGDIDASFAFLADQLVTPDQLNHFFSIDLTDSMRRLVQSGYYIGEATIAGVLCDNLALRNEGEDVQLWIAKGDKPVPRRIVVTYKNVEGQPQFRAQFVEWEFSPDLPDGIFSFSPPAHAERVDFFRDTPADRLE